MDVVDSSPGAASLWRLERAGLAFAGLLVLAFAGLVEFRSCFHNRMTDVGVYLRAAWAVRSGADLYRITDDNAWHYIYPPAFAVLMTPLADAPPGEDRTGLLPYPMSVALWTMLNLALVGRMAHVLATLLLPFEPRGTRRWWYARTVPIMLALGGLGYSISHGQVNVLLLALIVEMARAAEQGRRCQSGLWLAAAIALKVIPAYLLLFPLFRRDGRAFLGVGLGLFLGLVVIPVTALGLDRTEDAYRNFVGHVLLPGSGNGSDPLLGKELTNSNATDSQSFQSVIHNNLYPHRKSQPQPSRETRLAHIALAATLTLLACFAAWIRGLPARSDRLIFLGVLTLLLLHSTPVSHMHYYAFGYPLLAALWLCGLARQPERVFPGWRVAAPLLFWSLGTTLPLINDVPIFDALRHRGLGLASSLMLGLHAIQSLNQPRENQYTISREPFRRAA